MAVTEELEPWVERVIDRALLKHAQRCTLRPRVRRLEIALAFLVGTGLIGTGLFGLLKLLGGP